ncbi:conjugal transfer protein TraF, partial [Enterococcus faecalis]|nr:conjugal transfer protein TraF [Enterococcus faecalis]MBJ1233966.1 conjugal transfer protein TraF [Enterococcus faecalis]MBJ1676164.1 conjugal transfer protein TraF [Enterococcus faecalis]
MEKKRITHAEELNHGDVIRVFSYEQNCGMDETTFTALVVACSDK